MYCNILVMEIIWHLCFKLLSTLSLKHKRAIQILNWTLLGCYAVNPILGGVVWDIRHGL